MRFNEFINRYIAGGNDSDSSKPREIGYLAQHDLFDQIPALMKDIIPFDYTAMTIDESADESFIDDVRLNVWFGPAGEHRLFPVNP